MALELSKKLKNALQKEQIHKQLIVEIAGVDHVFGISHVKKQWRIGEDDVTIGQDDLTIGGTIKDSRSKALIDNKRTQSNITQQLDFEQGVSSVSSIKISLVDEGGFLSRDFSPTPTFDILGQEATVYWGVKDLSHPEDSVKLFEGIIDDCVFGMGYVDIKISHPEQLKRRQIFPQIQESLPSAINSSVTTIPINNLYDFTFPLGQLETYIKIDDEIIKYNDYWSDEFLECERGALNTIPASHDAGAEVISFYVLKGNPIDLTLSLLMSREVPFNDVAYALRLPVLSLNQVTPDQFVQNSIVVARGTIDAHNIQRGDTVGLMGAPGTNGGWDDYPDGNIGGATIIDTRKGDQFDYVVVDKYITTDPERAYTVNFVSKYQTMTLGCEIIPKYIDIEEFERLKAIASNELVDCEIYIKDSIDNAKEFIDQKILRPQGLYTIPRKGRISVGKLLPPIADAETKTIDHRNILKGTSPEIRRSTNRNFYNTVRYELNEDSLEDKFLKKYNYYDVTSLTKINVGNRPLIIEGYSLRDNAETRTFIDAQAKRFLERYKFSSEVVSVKTNLKTGFSIEVNDTAIVDLSAYMIGDITTASRSFIPRLMQVVNKNLDMRSNTVTLELASTTFEVDARYAGIAPSSLVGPNSSLTRIDLKKMLPKTTDAEKNKWENYIGSKILLRSNDWSYQEEAELLGIDTASDALLIKDPLSQIPSSGLIVDTPRYDDSDYREMSIYKRLHAFINPSLEVVSGISTTQFEVSPEDMGKLFVGSILYIHNSSYERRATEVLVSELSGTTVTLEAAIEFTPESGDVIDLVGFLDGGLPYRLI